MLYPAELRALTTRSATRSSEEARNANFLLVHHYHAPKPRFRKPLLYPAELRGREGLLAYRQAAGNPVWPFARFVERRVPSDPRSPHAVFRNVWRLPRDFEYSRQSRFGRPKPVGNFDLTRLTYIFNL